MSLCKMDLGADSLLLQYGQLFHTLQPIVACYTLGSNSLWSVLQLLPSTTLPIASIYMEPLLLEKENHFSCMELKY